MRHDDWITKLYIEELINKQMKYTEQGLIQTIKTESINYIWAWSPTHINSNSISFELEFLNNTGKITIQGIEIRNWLFDLLYDKILTLSKNNIPEVLNELTKLKQDDGDPILFVEEYGSEYLLKMLYHIINQLLDSENKLLSIKLV
jgi:hypothetical protein